MGFPDPRPVDSRFKFSESGAGATPGVSSSLERKSRKPKTALGGCRLPPSPMDQGGRGLTGLLGGRPRLFFYLFCVVAFQVSYSLFFLVVLLFPVFSICKVNSTTPVQKYPYNPWDLPPATKSWAPVQASHIFCRRGVGGCTRGGPVPQKIWRCFVFC